MVFAYDLSILESSIGGTERAAQVLEQAASKIGLKINLDKTKIIELLDYGNNTNTIFIELKKSTNFST